MSRSRVPAERFAIGEYIQDELDALGWTHEDLATASGLPAYEVKMLLIQRHGITVEQSEALGRAFGTSAKLWYGLGLLGLIYDMEQDGAS